ncbi:hypothetical protein ABOM_001582 [Aspergillus bombycis]|uniref:Transferase family protein n=1 Tax=Aspergillus bombycis TaxID=109264 RepID=A0A1F8ADY8_9EURO|nr:hypothetical protein ABOM_001582 [Aspergillus bombycis]OGM49934.1 hypothetical protein ABOM_001582 [Aspergillus bombycis]
MTASTVKVTVAATHVVHSKHPILLQDPFMLGPFDQLGHFATPINVVWIYESSSAIGLIPLERLRNAISRVLDYYPHLTGRMRIDPTTEVRSMASLGSGVHLLEAYCDATLQSFARTSPASGRGFSVFDFPRSGNALLAPWDLSREGIQQNPVFTIQRTEFACASVAIGMRLSHVVTGAGGFLQLYQDLAAIYRATTDLDIGGHFELASPPCLTPFMITQMQHMSDDEQRKALAEGPSAYSLRHSDTGAEIHAQNEARFEQSPEMDLIVGRTLRFSPAAIATLKGWAVEPGSGSDARISAWAALSAHLWQHTHRARLARAADLNSSTDGEKTNVLSSSAFGTSVNFVPHLGLPERSFGNTVVTPVVELESTKLAHSPFWEIAKIISNLTRHVSVNEVHKIGSWIAAQPKKSLIQLDFPVTPASFISTGWHRFPLYSGAELDVAPTFASPIFMDTLFDGMVFFVEPKVKDGSVEVVASLRSSTWESLDTDGGFITNWDRTA